MPFEKGWNKKKLEKKAEAPATTTDQKVASPIVKAFYVEKTTGTWKLCIVEIQDEKVISKKEHEAMNKSHCLEEFKIQFGRYYYFGK